MGLHEIHKPIASITTLSSYLASTEGKLELLNTLQIKVN